MDVIAFGGADLAVVVVLAGIAGAVVASLVVCGLKGKYGMIAGGLIVHPLWYVGAIRLAKPDSWWARRKYTGAKLEEARARAARGGFLSPAQRPSQAEPEVS